MISFRLHRTWIEWAVGTIHYHPTCMQVLFPSSRGFWDIRFKNGRREWMRWEKKKNSCNHTFSPNVITSTILQNEQKNIYIISRELVEVLSVYIYYATHLKEKINFSFFRLITFIPVIGGGKSREELHVLLLFIISKWGSNVLI